MYSTLIFISIFITMIITLVILSDYGTIKNIEKKDYDKLFKPELFNTRQEEAVEELVEVPEVELINRIPMSEVGGFDSGIKF